MQDTIATALQVLHGLPVRGLYRAVDMLMISFGELRQIPGGRRGIRTVADWDLHLQCPWRFTQGSTISLASRDMYYDADTGDRFDLKNEGEEGSTGRLRFDVLAAPLNAWIAAEALTVTAITCDRVGGFSLAIGPDLFFDVFPAESTCAPESEFWRLFQAGTEGDHFVVDNRPLPAG